MSQITFKIPESYFSNKEIKDMFPITSAVFRLEDIFDMLDLDYSCLVNVFIDSYKIDKTFNPTCHICGMSRDIMETYTYLTVEFVHGGLPSNRTFNIDVKEYILSQARVKGIRGGDKMSRVIINIPTSMMTKSEISRKLFMNATKPDLLSDVFCRLNLNYARFYAFLTNKGIIEGRFDPFILDPEIKTDYSTNSNNVVVMFPGTHLGDDRVIVVNAEQYINGKKPGFYPIMKENENMHVIPKIADIELFNEDGGLPTVKVIFTDGSHTTATCSEADISHFSFEQGIGICLGKKMLGPAYNRLIEKGCKMYFKKVEAQQKAVDDRRKQADILARKKAKRDARIARRKEKQRQEKVDILVEAIRKAKPGMYTVEDVEKSTEIINDAFKNWVDMAKKEGNVAEEKKCGPSRKEKVLYLRELGHTYKEIAEELGISKTTIGRIIRESNND